MAREQALIFLTFNPIIKDGQGFKKLNHLISRTNLNNKMKLLVVI